MTPEVSLVGGMADIADSLTACIVIYSTLHSAMLSYVMFRIVDDSHCVNN
jgi:hypothetical protein